MIFRNSLLAVLLHIAVQQASSQSLVLTWATATVTQCFVNVYEPGSLCNGACVMPTLVRPAVDGQPTTVRIDAPSCRACGCDNSIKTAVYTTTFEKFCPTGLSQQAYVVTETYSGVCMTPGVVPTAVPFGFTTEVQTCTTCGDEPISATITLPVQGIAYVTRISNPFPAPAGAKPYEIDFNEAEKYSPAEHSTRRPGNNPLPTSGSTKDILESSANDPFMFSMFSIYATVLCSALVAYQLSLRW